LDLAKASAIEKEPVPDYGEPAPAHKFSDLVISAA
jgi:hypothetical protein